jgi:polyhydroxyalkanoate synthase
MAKQSSPSLPNKKLLYLINMIEHQFFEENLVVSNLTPYEEIFRDGPMSVRHYPPLEDTEILVDNHTLPVAEKKYRVPLVLVPALAATAVCFDLFPNRSIVRYLLAQGFDVYLIDWGEVTFEQRHQSLERYIRTWYSAAMKSVRDTSGQQEVSLIGYCMGGLLSLMYVADSGDENVRNIVTVVSPIDWDQNGVAGQLLSLIRKPAKAISHALSISLMDVPARTFHVPGWMNSILFKMTDPVGSLTQYWDLMVNMWDREFLVKQKTMGKWFDEMEDFPGEMAKNVVTEWIADNQLASGKVKVGEKTVDFAQINASLLAFGGRTDNVVRPATAEKILELIASEDKEFRVVPGGHAGAMAGSKAFSNTWPLTVEWLAARSA